MDYFTHHGRLVSNNAMLFDSSRTQTMFTASCIPYNYTLQCKGQVISHLHINKSSMHKKKNRSAFEVNDLITPASKLKLCVSRSLIRSSVHLNLFLDIYMYAFTTLSEAASIIYTYLTHGRLLPCVHEVIQVPLNP